MPNFERTEVNSQAAELLNADKFDEVGKLPGILTFEVKDPNWSDDICCAEYTFGLRLGEPWAQDKMPQIFWDDGLEFLLRNGYVLVEEPEIGDIVGYAVTSLIERYPNDDPISALSRAYHESLHRNPPYLEHFGILTEGGKVISKFGTGHVYLHDVDKVPSHFGSEIYFFRKL